ncbi:hypothetical protein Btru_064857 [Bulinus truncatus]|nr:hypothetical protein Btru_064857 [Bulinus truncatus]
MEDTIVSVMKAWADTSPDAIVFTFVNKRGVHLELTPLDVYRRAARFAARLRGRYGFGQGDVIANAIPNSPERLVTDFGVILAGCVMVNAQVLHSDGSDFYNTVNYARCRGVILPNRTDHSAYKHFQPLIGDGGAEMTEIHVPQALTLTKVLVCSRDDSDNATDLMQSLSLGEGEEEEGYTAEVSPSDLAVLFTTSGTSGFCKLVPRSHEQILLAGRSFQGGKSGKYFSDRPFGWMGGFPFDYLAYCSHRVLQDKFYDLSVTSAELWEMISRQKCTGAAILPVTLLDLIQVFRHTRPDYKIPFIVTGGQPIKKSLADAIGLLTNALVVSYSSTECAMVSAGMVTSADQMKDNCGGQPGKDISVKIVDDSGRQLTSNQTGFILLKSPYMLTNYYPPAPASSIFTPDGYFKTGDRGMLDDGGNLYCFGRSGDVISQGAFLVYTSWPEEVLAKCPDVADVTVLVIPNQVKTDDLYACVVPRPGSDVTKEALLDFYNASFMSSTGSEGFQPELVDIFMFERFPETFTGKVSKPKLKDLVMKQLKLS